MVKKQAEPAEQAKQDNKQVKVVANPNLVGISREVTATVVRTNRIIIDFSTSRVEVESYDCSLDKVLSIADTIARNLGRGSIDGKEPEERLRNVGVR